MRFRKLINIILTKEVGLIMKNVKIIGLGLGSSEFLTPYALKALENADEVFITDTLGKRLELSMNNIISVSLSDLAEKVINSTSKNIAIPVSGDVNFFSLSQTLEPKLNACEDIALEFINGLSSMQYFFAKLKKRYDDAKIISAHGRKIEISAVVSYNKKVFALTGGENNAALICQTLVERGLADVSVSIGENLGLETEKLYVGSAKDFANSEISSLSVMLIENPKAVNPDIMFSDEDFERAKVPMTKEEIRWLSVSKLQIQPKDIVYDIGAGTGSVTLEMAKKARESLVYAVEQKEAAVVLIKQNIKNLGCHNIELIQAKAPECMETWEAPDKVFIGGSSGNLGDILMCIINKAKIAQKTFKLVINTVTIETLVEASEMLTKLDFEDIEYVNISSAKSQKMGNYNLMIAANPVYIISACYNAV